VGPDEKQGCRLDPWKQEAQKLQRRFVGLVDVFQDDDGRRPLGEERHHLLERP
jgi:hypothetical protein